MGRAGNPSTAEWVNEYQGPGGNPDYWFEIISDALAWDSNGTLHTDPGNSSGIGDPYIVVEETDGQNGSGTPFSVPEWNDDEWFPDPNPIQDPMWFIWNTSQ
jgi:hypothetical protein